MTRPGLEHSAGAEPRKRSPPCGQHRTLAGPRHSPRSWQHSERPVGSQEPCVLIQPIGRRGVPPGPLPVSLVHGLGGPRAVAGHWQQPLQRRRGGPSPSGNPETCPSLQQPLGLDRSASIVGPGVRGQHPCQEGRGRRLQDLVARLTASGNTRAESGDARLAPTSRRQQEARGEQRSQVLAHTATTRKHSHSSGSWAWAPERT